MTALTQDDIRFFKSEGYLIKRGVLDGDLMERAREVFWAALPPELDRHDPETWSRKMPARKDPPNSIGDHTWKYRELGGEDWMIQLLPSNPHIWTMAEQLLGVGTLRPPERLRGIYATFPQEDEPPGTPTCHCEGHAFHLGVVGYIDRVFPHGGGLKVWPGSHRSFYYAFAGRYATERDERYDRTTEHYDQQPCVDFYGDAGDIIFWHHRLAHSGGHNRSRQIRLAVFYDFMKQDLEAKLNLPPAEDMWEDWSEKVRGCD